MRLGPGDTVGGWVLGKKLGAGGMGAVYSARSALDPTVQCALKVLSGASVDDARQRFDREVQSLRTLDHPNIVGIQGWGVDDQREVHWLAMDLVIGQTLQRRLMKGAAEPAVARGWFEGLAAALAHAHEQGIFHRDVKPANVIIRDDGQAVLVDFGIALQDDRTRLTQEGLAVGTPDYMCPEVFKGLEASGAHADVYALGVMLYEALTGDPAFRAGAGLTDSQRLVALVGMKLDSSALDLPDAWSDAWSGLIRQATSPDPSARFADAGRLLTALRALPTSHVRTPTTQWIPVPRPEEATEAAAAAEPMQPEGPADPTMPLPVPVLAPESHPVVAASEGPPRTGRGALAAAGGAVVTLSALAATALVCVGGGALAWGLGALPTVVSSPVDSPAPTAHIDVAPTPVPEPDLDTDHAPSDPVDAPTPVVQRRQPVRPVREPAPTPEPTPDPEGVTDAVAVVDAPPVEEPPLAVEEPPLAVVPPEPTPPVTPAEVTPPVVVPTGPPRLDFRFGSPSVSKVLTDMKAPVMSKTTALGQSIMTCYDQRTTDSVTRARVVLKYKVDRTGQVSEAAISRSDLREAKVEACIVKTMLGRQFGKPDKLGSLTVVQPISSWGI